MWVMGLTKNAYRGVVLACSTEFFTDSLSKKIAFLHKPKPDSEYNCSCPTQCPLNHSFIRIRWERRQHKSTDSITQHNTTQHKTQLTPAQNDNDNDVRSYHYRHTNPLAQKHVRRKTMSLHAMQWSRGTIEERPGTIPCWKLPTRNPVSLQEGYGHSVQSRLDNDQRHKQ